MTVLEMVEKGCRQCPVIFLTASRVYLWDCASVTETDRYSVEVVAFIILPLSVLASLVSHD